jgi:hypothetical protein
MGQKLTSHTPLDMSAFLPEADLALSVLKVRYVPTADICSLRIGLLAGKNGLPAGCADSGSRRSVL